MTLVRAPAGAAMALIALAWLAGCLGSAAGAFPLEVRTGAGNQLVFEPARLVAPAGRQLLLTLRNTSAEPHNLVVLEPVGVATRSIVAAGQADAIAFEAPPAGSYRFVCSIHPGMEGTLEVH